MAPGEMLAYCSELPFHQQVRVRTPPGNLEYSWIFIWNFSGPGKPGEMMLFFEI